MRKACANWKQRIVTGEIMVMPGRISGQTFYYFRKLLGWRPSSHPFTLFDGLHD
jgi:hypothetical protein